MKNFHFFDIRTNRLNLRKFDLADTDRIVQLAGEFEIADTTLRIPHPYYAKDARKWLQQQSENSNHKREITWAISLKQTSELIGTIGLMNFNKDFEHAELGYWIGKPFWNKGYATEAGKSVIRYGFENLKLHRIHAHHFSRNASSGKVLLKIGMVHEGTLKQHVKKWDKFEDIKLYGILKSEIDFTSNF